MPGRPQSAPHGTPARYRYGCHCTPCRQAHAEESAAWKFTRKYGPGAPLGPEKRREILKSLRRTHSVIATAKELGLTHQAIYGAALAVEEFGRQVDELTGPRD